MTNRLSAGSPQGETDFSLPVTNQLNIMLRDGLARTGLNFRLDDCPHTFGTRTLNCCADLLSIAAVPRHFNPNRATHYEHSSVNRKIESIPQSRKKEAKAAQAADFSRKGYVSDTGNF
jgi:hypothetical protein